MNTRRYTEFEKKVIMAIVDTAPYDCFLFNILDPYLGNAAVNVTSAGEVSFRIGVSGLPMQNGEATAALTRVRELEKLIVRTISLIDHLVSERLLIAYVPSTDNPEFRLYGPLPEDAAKVYSQFPDPNLAKLLNEYSLKVLIPSPDLALLVKRNFRDVDEERFIRQYRVTWVAIGIAVLTALASQISSCRSSREINGFLAGLTNGIADQQRLTADVASVLTNGIPVHVSGLKDNLYRLAIEANASSSNAVEALVQHADKQSQAVLQSLEQMRGAVDLLTSTLLTRAIADTTNMVDVATPGP